MKSTEQMTASDVMHRSVFCADPDQKLSDVEQQLFEAHVTGMPVVDSGRLVGVISQTDALRLPQMMKAWIDYAVARSF